MVTARRLEQASELESGSSKGGNAAPEKYDQKKRKHNNQIPQDIKPLRAVDPRGREVVRDVTCYECGKKGHTKNQCYRLKGGCFRCGNTEHRIAECPQVRRQDPPVLENRLALMPPPEPRQGFGHGVPPRAPLPPQREVFQHQNPPQQNQYQQHHQQGRSRGGRRAMAVVAEEAQAPSESSVASCVSVL